MLSPLLLTLSVYFTDVLSVRAPRSSRIDDSSVVASLASTNLQLPANISTISSNASSLSSNTLKIGCDARQFGRNLKVKSCRDLFGYLELDTEELVFAQRDSGIPYDIPLPLRTYSSVSNLVIIHTRLYDLIIARR